MITLPELTPYTGDVVAPSPNHDARKSPVIQGIVLHATQDAGNEARSLSWMRSPRSRVSCHLLVGRDGHVTRLVGDKQRAWHAGASWWRGTTDVNSITLGIEIANRNDGEPFTRAQYARVAAIVAHYCTQGLSLDDVVSHGQIAPGRRIDPLGWNWNRFRSLVRTQLSLAELPLPAATRARVRILTPDDIDVSAAPVPVTRVTPPAASGTVLAAPKPGPVLASAKSTPVLANPKSTRVLANPKPGRVLATPKPVLHSRTVWLNALTALAAGAAILGEALKLAFGFGLVLPEDVTKWVLFAVGLVNVLLRLRTTQPVACSASCETAVEPLVSSPPAQQLRRVAGAKR